MKSLRSELRPLLICLGAFSFFMNLLFLVPALFMSQVFDRVLTTYSGETLLVLLAGTSVALLLLLVLDYVRSRLQTVLGNLIEEHLSPRVVSATVTRQARAHAESTPDGLRDVATLGAAFSANGIVAVLDAPWVVVYVAFIWASHPLLGLCAGIAALIMLGLAWVNHRLSQTAILSVQKDSRRAARYVESSLRNAEVLYGLGMAEALIERWRGMQERIHTAQSNAHRMAAMFSAGTRSFRQQIQVVMLALGAYLVITGKASAGIMIATTILLGRALQPVEQLVSSWRTLTEARAAYARLKVLAETVGDLEHAPMELPRPSGNLTAEGLILRSPDSDRIVLHNISFHLDSGQALAIVGPSAAGKSSLVRLLIGVWRPTAGTVRLDGADVALWSRVELGRWIGYVPQDVELFDGTVAENIARLGGVDAQAVVAAARRADAHDLILSLSQGYETQVGEGGANLSPGQRQRIALARALYGNPRFVVLDEPNSNLDGVGELALARVIDRLRGDGVTVVVITHRPSLIAHVDTVLVVDGGRMQQFVPASHFLQAIKTRAQRNSVAVAA